MMEKMLKRAVRIELRPSPFSLCMAIIFMELAIILSDLAIIFAILAIIQEF
ncbi:hypothetical protein ACFPN4_13470 [Ureibacillus thermophilus]|uniref:hypothetical protein n=1 Tax=Ureibacillus thermophilus TaxID=367743 RepID=UPI001ABF8E39|nr:hypothetical protein [Ureibacillus thermophilus]